MHTFIEPPVYYFQENFKEGEWFLSKAEKGLKNYYC